MPTVTLRRSNSRASRPRAARGMIACSLSLAVSGWNVARSEAWGLINLFWGAKSFNAASAPRGSNAALPLAVLRSADPRACWTVGGWDVSGMTAMGSTFYGAEAFNAGEHAAPCRPRRSLPRVPQRRCSPQTSRAGTSRP